MRKIDKKEKNGISESTFRKYIFARNRMEYFLRYSVKDSPLGQANFNLPISKVNDQFIDDFYFFLLYKGQCAHNSAVKHIWYFKQVIEEAIKNRIIKYNPFHYRNLNYNQVERSFLEEEELEKFIMTKLESKRMEKVRDIFLFCCYTGLSYSDVAKLSNEHISTDLTGKRWIKIYRTKTKILSIIPLFDIPEMILKKYENNVSEAYSFFRKKRIEGALLPVTSNQKINSTLKDIAILCGLKKNITLHTARHTFATYCLLIGISIESISKMLGHTKIKTTQIYARITRHKIDKEMVAKKDDFNRFSALYFESLKSNL